MRRLLQGKGDWRGDRPAVWRTYFQKLTQPPSPGVFVDVGAGDGRFMSNTAFLEGYHCWRGVAVEPTDNEYPKLEKNRPGATTVRRTAKQDSVSSCYGTQFCASARASKPMAHVHGV